MGRGQRVSMCLLASLPSIICSRIETPFTTLFEMWQNAQNSTDTLLEHVMMEELYLI